MKFKNSKKLLSLLLTFMLIFGVTVCAMIAARADEPITITGPTGAFRANTNGAAFTIGPFTITGNPASVTAAMTNTSNTSNSPQNIAWSGDTTTGNVTGTLRNANNANTTLTITATGAGGETVTHNIFLRQGTVTAANSITYTVTQPTLREGYAQTSQAVTIGANNSPASLLVTGYSSAEAEEKIKLVVNPIATGSYNAISGRFEIADGLSIGTHTVNCNLTNITNSRAVTFTVTVIADTPNIIAPARIPATSTVAAKMHLAPDYSETVTTEAFVSNASLAPATISLLSSPDPLITLNAANQLVVAPGLAVGEYPVTVRADNGKGTADVVYTVKVWDQQPTVPTIDGPNGAKVRRSLTYQVGPYNLGGYPLPTSVSLSANPSNFSAASYNMGTHMLQFTTGSSLGNTNNSYVLTASNEYGSATHEIMIRGQNNTNAVAAPTTPSIPAGTLSEGYPRTEFAMTVGGNELPASVFITNDPTGKVSYYMGSGSGNGEQNGKFIVEPGLTEGSYPVEFKVTNFGGNDLTGLIFTVNVGIDEPTIAPPPSYPAASKSDTMNTWHIGPLTEPATSPQFDVRSNILAEMFLETTDWPEITINDNYQLVVAPGLPIGNYPITVRASNGIGTDPTATYNIRVWEQTPIPLSMNGPPNAMTQPGLPAFFMGPWDIQAYPPVNYETDVSFERHWTDNKGSGGDLSPMRATFEGNVSYLPDSKELRLYPAAVGIGNSAKNFVFEFKIKHEFGDVTRVIYVRAGTSNPQAGNSIQVAGSTGTPAAMSVSLAAGYDTHTTGNISVGNGAYYASLVIAEDPTGGKVKWIHGSNTYVQSTGTMTMAPGQFVVQPGLAPGVYVVKCLATNFTNSRPINFTITVTGPTGFTGPSSVMLPTGYGALSTEAFSVVNGASMPAVTILSVDPPASEITWNSSTNKLDVAAGLAPGEYVVELQATNAAGTDLLTFTLTVESAPPTFTGPEGLTIRDGYEETASDAFTITGAPEPTITLDSDYPEITWNDNTKKLDIAAGLAQGDYTITLTAANGEGPDVELTFTLKVVSEFAPIITGASQLTLQKGYGATTSQFLITGSQPITATLDSAFEQITWDDTAKRLLIAPGLEEGKYPVTLTATNGQNPDHVYTITVSVEKAKNAPIIYGPNSVQYKESIQLRADQPVTWKSNSKNLTVSADGKVKANYRFFYKTAKAATLTATGVDNGLTTEYHVRIFMSWPQWILAVVFFGWIWM